MLFRSAFGTETTAQSVETRKISQAEINQHNSAESCWVVINDSVYDVTRYLKIHPGGTSMFLSPALVNRDMTNAYRVVHASSQVATSWLQSYCIGTRGETPCSEFQLPQGHPRLPEGIDLSSFVCPYRLMMTKPEDKPVAAVTQPPLLSSASVAPLVALFAPAAKQGVSAVVTEKHNLD